MRVLPREIQDYFEQPLTGATWGQQVDLSRSQPVNPVVLGPSADRIAGGCGRGRDVPQQDTREELVLDETPLLFRTSQCCQNIIKKLISSLAPSKDAAIASIRWCDGRLAADWQMSSRAVVTTANATWMPEFPVASPGQICTRVDGRWGPQEYSLWPQVYHPKVLHHACIPVKDAKIRGQGFVFKTLHDPIPPHEWEEDYNCGMPELGFLRPQFLESLKADADAVITKFKRCGADTKADQKQYGYALCSTITQAFDRLLLLPTSRMHAVALAAHVQRLCLELSGLTVLFDILQPRTRDVGYVAKDTLPLRGAFTSNPSTAQAFFKLRIPVWFIQPLTKHVRVLEVVTFPT